MLDMVFYKWWSLLSVLRPLIISRNSQQHLCRPTYPRVIKQENAIYQNITSDLRSEV